MKKRSPPAVVKSRVREAASLVGALLIRALRSVSPPVGLLILVPSEVFGFFLDGNNIALIPGTTTPVSINNVNGGNPFGTNATNPGFYNNNDPNDPGSPSFDIEYDGFTKVFQAQALNLKPGTHTIKLAIADTGDSSLDSAVFIQGGSFSDEPATPIPFEFSPTLGLLALGIWGAIAQLKSLVQKCKSAESAFSKN